MRPLENETPMELAICIKDLAEKDCPNRQDAVDVMFKEQVLEVLPDEVMVWLKERKPKILMRLVNWLRTTDRLERQS